MHAFYILKRRMLGLPDPVLPTINGGSGYISHGFGDGNINFGDGSGDGEFSIPSKLVPSHDEHWTIYEYSSIPHGAGYGTKLGNG